MSRISFKIKKQPFGWSYTEHHQDCWTVVICGLGPIEIEVQYS